MSEGETREPGGCRSIVSGGCLLGLGALWLAAAAFLLVLFLVLWLVQFGLSFLF
jgi:hypothetical protein